ncbi:MAG: flagellar hook-basal body complex protein [Oscillospiraceae bacterium]|nr:flagellar hook-basal body complex protein [Oscillospiraceae bacterium]
MVRSLYSGVSGLTTHQTRMDVIGNNIANVNTYGFKASRVTFRDIYYQTSIKATAGNVTFGGNNAAQVGYGVQLGSIDKDMSQSSGQNTGKLFDLMLDGDGMFMTATYSSLNLSSDKSASTVKFTRMGMFTIDSYGNLASSNNVLLVGSRNSLAGLHNTGDMSANYLNDVEIIDRSGDGVISSEDVTFRNVINLNELIQTAYNIFTDDYGYMYGYHWDDWTNAAGQAQQGIISTYPPGTANSPVVYDLARFGGTAQQLIDAANASDNPTEFLKQYIDVHDTLENLNMEGATAGVPTGAPFRYYCDETGSEVYDATQATKTEINYTTQYTALYNARNDATALETARNALKGLGGLIGEVTYGKIQGCDVARDGVITVTYNGEMKAIARIEVAVFDNYDGLLEDGDTTFTDSVASGRAKIMKAADLPETRISSGKLEMSNVNLAQEFSDMIVTQRGFQANARIITTSDSMLEELVNLKR